MHPTLKSYDYQAYFVALRFRSCVCACLLCGQMHRLHVHDYLGRLVRSAEGENQEILIVSIICYEAKRRGRQYTKRMLPEFVIPECNIRLDRVLKLVQARSVRSVDSDEACRMLGAMDERTVRRHLWWAEQVIEVTLVALSEVLAGLAAIGALPQLRVGERALSHLRRLIEELERVEEKVGGQRSDRLSLQAGVHTVYLFHRCRKPPAVPLNRVVKMRLFFDTS